MHPPDSIEAMLQRLMPPALSEDGQRSIDAMFDELCGEETPAVPARKGMWKFALPPVGIAAATAFAFFHPFGEEKPRAVADVEVAPVQEMIQIGETVRIESLSDEGWIADSRGAAMQAVQAKVVKEDTFRDEETGIVVQISEPREEMIFYPVSQF